MKISILIPAKNAAPYLADCLQSIAEQTETDWECILVNDNSTDDTPQIAATFANADARFKVLNNPKSGIINALRWAYQHSNGDFIHRMDADDLMPPHKLATLKHALQTAGAGHVATGKVRYFSETTLGEGYQKYASWLNQLTETGDNFSELYKECVIASPCWLVYRHDFERCGGFESDIYPEDYDLVFRFYAAGLRVLPCSEVLHLWRDYQVRTSRTSEHYADNRFIAIKCFYFLKLNYDAERSLVVWGAGRKGKATAHYLAQQNIPFRWVCNNEKKIGKDIYNVRMESTAAVEALQRPQIIVAVANEDEQQVLKHFFETKNWKTMIDFFFFC